MSKTTQETESEIESIVKVIDKPEILVIEPLNYYSSIKYFDHSKLNEMVRRYGYYVNSKGRSFLNEKNWIKTTEKSILIYLILYKLDDYGKRGEDKLKLIIQKKVMGVNKSALICRDRFGNNISSEVLEALIDKDNYNMLFEYFLNNDDKFKSKLKMSVDIFKVGDFVKGIGDLHVNISYIEYYREKWKKHLKKEIRWWQTRKSYKDKNFTIFNFLLRIKRGDIERAEILKVYKGSIKVRPIKIKNISEEQQGFIDSFEPTFNLPMTMGETIKILKN